MPVKKSGLGKGLDSLIPNKKENKDISPRFDKKNYRPWKKASKKPESW